MRQFPASLMKFTRRIILNNIIFKILLLYKLTTEVLFRFYYNLLKQANGCTVGGSLSMTLADIHKIRVETDIVLPHRPVLYKRYVDYIYNRLQKNTFDKLYRAKHISSNFTNEVTLIRNKFILRYTALCMSLLQFKQIRAINSSYHLGFLKLRKKYSLWK